MTNVNFMRFLLLIPLESTTLEEGLFAFYVNLAKIWNRKVSSPARVLCYFLRIHRNLHQSP